MPGCPIYGPAGTRPAPQSGVSPSRVLIKELALEVEPSDNRSGVEIHLIYMGGKGQRAGLKAGDRIHRFNGRRVKDVEQFQSLVAQARPESTVPVRIIRDKKKIDVQAMIGEGEMEGVTIPSPPSNTGNRLQIR